MERPRLSRMGLPVLAAAMSNWKFCALRAPIWMMSVYSATRSACCSESNSVMTARPVSLRALASSFKPFSPRPWNSYGDVRGLNAPPRRMVAPAAFTASAVVSNCFSLSTEHGPAMTWNFFPPMHVLADFDGGVRRVRLAADELVALLHRHDALDDLRELRDERFEDWCVQFVADGADDGARHAAHDVRAVAELADFLEDGGFLLSWRCRV